MHGLKLMGMAARVAHDLEEDLEDAEKDINRLVKQVVELKKAKRAEQSSAVQDASHLLGPKSATCPGILLHSRTIEGPATAINSIVYSRTRNAFITADDESLRLWTLQGTLVRAQPLSGRVECLVYNEEHDVLYAVRENHTLLCFHGTFLNEIASTTCPRAILCLALWKAKNVLFASGVGALIQGWQAVKERRTASMAVEDGPWIPTKRRAGGYSLSQWGELRESGPPSKDWTQRLLVAEEQKIMFAAKGMDVQVWHLETKICLFTLEGLHFMPITSIFWNGDSGTLMTAAQDRVARLWDINNPLQTLTALGGGHGGKRVASEIALLETLNTHKRAVTCITQDPHTGSIFTCSEDGAVKIYRPGIWQEWDSLQIVALPGAKVSDAGIEPFYDCKYRPGFPSSVLVLPADKYSPKDCVNLVIPTGNKIVLLRFIHSKGVLGPLPRPPLMMCGINDDRFTHDMTATRRRLQPALASTRSHSLLGVREEDMTKELMVLTEGGSAVFLDTRLGTVHKVVNPKPDTPIYRDNNLRPARDANPSGGGGMGGGAEGGGDTYWRQAMSHETGQITTVAPIPRAGNLMVGWSTGLVQVYDLSTGLYKRDLEIQKTLFKQDTKVFEQAAVTVIETFRPVEPRFTLMDNDNAREGLRRASSTWSIRSASKAKIGAGGVEISAEPSAASDASLPFAKTVRLLTMVRKWRRLARRPVIATGFSSGLLVLWDERHLNYPIVADAHDKAIVAIEYYSVRNHLITAGEEGTVKIWTFSSSMTEKELAMASAKGTRRLCLLNILCHNAGAITSMILTPMTRYDVMNAQGGPRVVVGYSEGTIEIFDLAKCDLSPPWVKQKGTKMGDMMAKAIDTAVRADESDKRTKDYSVRAKALGEAGPSKRGLLTPAGKGTLTRELSRVKSFAARSQPLPGRASAPSASLVGTGEALISEGSIRMPTRMSTSAIKGPELRTQALPAGAKSPAGSSDGSGSGPSLSPEASAASVGLLGRVALFGDTPARPRPSEEIPQDLEAEASQASQGTARSVQFARFRVDLVGGEGPERISEEGEPPVLNQEPSLRYPPPEGASTSAGAPGAPRGSQSDITPRRSSLVGTAGGGADPPPRVSLSGAAAALRASRTGQALEGRRSDMSMGAESSTASRLALAATRKEEPLGVTGTWEALQKRSAKPDILSGGHIRMITGIAVSQDGRFMATSCLSGVVSLWDYRRRIKIHEYVFRVPVYRMLSLVRSFNLLVGLESSICTIDTQAFTYQAGPGEGEDGKPMLTRVDTDVAFQQFLQGGNTVPPPRSTLGAASLGVSRAALASTSDIDLDAAADGEPADRALELSSVRTTHLDLAKLNPREFRSVRMKMGQLRHEQGLVGPYDKASNWRDVLAQKVPEPESVRRLRVLGELQHQEEERLRQVALSERAAKHKTAEWMRPELVARVQAQMNRDKFRRSGPLKRHGVATIPEESPKPEPHQPTSAAVSRQVSMMRPDLSPPKETPGTAPQATPSGPIVLLKDPRMPLQDVSPEALRKVEKRSMLAIQASEVRREDLEAARVGEQAMSKVMRVIQKDATRRHGLGAIGVHVIRDIRDQKSNNGDASAPGSAGPTRQSSPPRPGAMPSIGSPGGMAGQGRPPGTAASGSAGPSVPAGNRVASARSARFSSDVPMFLGPRQGSPKEVGPGAQVRHDARKMLEVALSRRVPAAGGNPLATDDSMMSEDADASEHDARIPPRLSRSPTEKLSRALIAGEIRRQDIPPQYYAAMEERGLTPEALGLTAASKRPPGLLVEVASAAKDGPKSRRGSIIRSRRGSILEGHDYSSGRNLHAERESMDRAAQEAALAVLKAQMGVTEEGEEFDYSSLISGKIKFTETANDHFSASLMVPRGAKHLMVGAWKAAGKEVPAARTWTEILSAVIDPYQDLRPPPRSINLGALKPSKDHMPTLIPEEHPAVMAALDAAGIRGVLPPDYSKLREFEEARKKAKTKGKKISKAKKAKKAEAKQQLQDKFRYILSLPELPKGKTARALMAEDKK